jgi:alanyl-tRNA synthetase
VVSVGEHSLELCGGTHVRSSAEIGTALLTQSAPVASGVRRIEMVTGEGALALHRDQRGALRAIAESLRAAPEEALARVEALQEELRRLRREESEQKKKGGVAALDGLLAGAAQAGGISVVVGAVDGDDAAALRTLGDAARKRAPASVLLLAGRGAEGASVLAMAGEEAVRKGVRAGDVLKRFVEGLGGKGGGRPDMAQGRVPRGGDLDAALRAGREEILRSLAAR